jgi:hypothetical protein
MFGVPYQPGNVSGSSRGGGGAVGGGDLTRTADLPGAPNHFKMFMRRMRYAYNALDMTKRFSKKRPYAKNDYLLAVYYICFEIQQTCFN